MLAISYLPVMHGLVLLLWFGAAAVALANGSTGSVGLL
jgi:hypothetical protein